jgi:hypothetical protein
MFFYVKVNEHLKSIYTNYNQQISKMNSNSNTIVLIENPKTFKDRENNKLYYRQKFFSKTQLNVLEKNAKFAEEANKHITKRANGGGGIGATMSGTCTNCPNYKNPKKNKQILPNSLSLSKEVEEEEHEIKEEKQTNIVALSLQEVDSWEELI